MDADACDEVLDALASTLRAQLAEIRASAPAEVTRFDLLERLVDRTGHDELPAEEKWIESAVSHLLIALDPPDEPEPIAALPGGALYRLTLHCEVRSEAEVDRLIDAMKTSACPYDDDEDHECPVPWMTEVERIYDDDEEAPGIREMLNRR